MNVASSEARPRERAKAWRVYLAVLIAPMIAPPMSAAIATMSSRAELIMKYLEGTASESEIELLVEVTIRMFRLVAFIGTPISWLVGFLVGYPILMLLRTRRWVSWYSITFICMAISIGLGTTIFSNAGSHIRRIVFEVVWYGVTGLMIGIVFYFVSGIGIERCRRLGASQ